jgi:RNA-directed DNA polymerase
MPTGRALQAIARREGLRFTTFVDDVTMSSQTDFKHVVPEIIETITSYGFKISQGKTTYKSGVTDITGVKMLNNSLTVTDKFIVAIEKEVDNSSPRAKGLLNYKERIKILSKSKSK